MSIILEFQISSQKSNLLSKLNLCNSKDQKEDENLAFLTLSLKVIYF